MTEDKIAAVVGDLLSKGKTKEDIYKELLGGGATLDQIENAFSSNETPIGDEETQKKTIKIILTVAAILVGAGIFSFIAANWQLMGNAMKVAVIIGGMAISYAIGWQLKVKSEMVKTSDAMMLLGSLIYGAGIFLVAQTFHIRANWPDGFILWMFGVTLIAWVLDSYTLYYFAIGLGLTSIFAHPFIVSANSVAGPFLLTSSSLLFIASVVTFLAGVTLRKKIPEELKKFL